MSAAVSGSVAGVEALVSPAFSRVRPEAQQLVDATRGWTPGSWQLGISNDFPAVANVTAARNGHGPTVRFAISWSDDRWTLVMGEPNDGASGAPGSVGSGAAKPLGPGPAPKVVPGESGPPVPPGPPTTSGPTPASCPPVVSAGVGPGPVHGAAALACRTFTSRWGYARGRNMYWLTATPLHLSFDPTDGVTMVVRMPCGVLNVRSLWTISGWIPTRPKWRNRRTVAPARMRTTEAGRGPISRSRWSTGWIPRSWCSPARSARSGSRRTDGQRL